MRNFLSNDGLFEIDFPTDWEYDLSDGDHIHQFQSSNNGIGSFHLSLIKKPIFEEHFSKFEFCKKLIENVPVNEALIKDKDYNTLLWLIKIENNNFLASYTYSNSYEESEKLTEDLNIIYSIISSLKIIPQNDRPNKISWYKFGKFLYGLGASNQLLSHAIDKGCFIEFICLISNQIDAMLRVSNILWKQIKNQNVEIDLHFIYQSEHDKPINERTIYKISKDNDIINQDTFDKLNNLYNERNKVIHRYIISEIKTQDILDIGLKYWKLREIIYDVVDKLEKKQIESKLGMTIKQLNYERKEATHLYNILNSEIEEKHGNMNFFDFIENN